MIVIQERVTRKKKVTSLSAYDAAPSSSFSQQSALASAATPQEAMPASENANAKVSGFSGGVRTLFWFEMHLIRLNRPIMTCFG